MSTYDVIVYTGGNEGKTQARTSVTQSKVKARVAAYFWFVHLPTINSAHRRYRQWLKSLQAEPVVHGMNDIHKHQKSSL